MKFLIFILLSMFSSHLLAEDCLKFDALVKKYQLDPSKKEIKNFELEGQGLLNELFNERIKLHNDLPNLTPACKIKLKEVFLKIRQREDYIGAHFYKGPQVSADSIDFKKIPLPIYSSKDFAPYHLTHPNEKFQFQTGDILITKGISFTSSTISEVVTPRSLFSHMVFLHVDEKTKKVSTMESYIGYGVKRFTIEEALKNENVRILVLRLKDQVVAKKAADYMYEKILSFEKKKEVIPYDYQLDFKDNTKLSCEEIAYDAFAAVTDKKLIIPENLSHIQIQDEEFLKRIGVRPGELMMPVDLETDSRFNIVLDWTDYKIIRDSLRKDAVTNIMFHWMNEYKYRIHENTRSIAARIVWSTRYIPGLWHIMAKLSGIPSDFQKDVPPIAISTMESLKSIGGVMLKFVTEADQEFYRRNSRWMTPDELRMTLDSYLRAKPMAALRNFHAK